MTLRSIASLHQYDLGDLERRLHEMEQKRALEECRRTAYNYGSIENNTLDCNTFIGMAPSRPAAVIRMQETITSPASLTQVVNTKEKKIPIAPATQQIIILTEYPKILGRNVLFEDGMNIPLEVIGQIQKLLKPYLK